MKKDYTLIGVVLDRSGSMQSTKKDTIAGFNSFVDEQKTVGGEATLTLAQFNTTYDLIHDNVPISQVPHLNEDTFVPDGMTALHDAICKTIDNIGKQMHEMTEDQRPEKVIFVIITDGLENSSRLFTRQDVANRIKHQSEVYKWQFVFLGANQDAIATGGSIGVGAASSMQYVDESQAVMAMYSAASARISDVRLGLSKSVEFTPEDRKLSLNERLEEYKKTKRSQ